MPPVYREYPEDRLQVAIAQIAPVWLNREQTLAKVVSYARLAADEGCDLVVFGEALLPGYPFWIERTEGARFNSPLQKDMHSQYVQEAVQIEADHLTEVCNTAAQGNMAIVLGCVERAADRGGHSLYASLVYIDQQGEIQSVHRKLMPTYEERLVWSPGDGHGLRVHKLGPFTVGGLNCWENWMPLPRAALYALGEDLHVAVWPGSHRNTKDITRFIALESRSFVISASGFLRRSDIPDDTSHAGLLQDEVGELIFDGGSCVAAPDGSWVVEPVTGEEALLVATLNHRQVRGERQNFDPAGHYARPDVTKLTVDRSRQSTLSTVN
jgi:nitrilase